MDDNGWRVIMPPKRKPGLSTDDKCDRIAKFFRQNPEPFTMKDLEKSIPKVVPGLDFRALPELIENLVAEGIVGSAKVSVTTLYWNAPASGAAAAALRQTPEEIQRAIDAAAAHQIVLEGQRDGSLADLTAARRGHMGPDPKEYETLTARWRHELPPILSEARVAYASVQERDPEAYAQLCRDVVAMRDGVNRWTDNMMIIGQHVTSRCGMSQEEFRRHFNVPKDFDYVLAKQ